MGNLSRQRLRRHRKPFLRYQCRKWNESHSPEKRLRRVELFVVREWTSPVPGEPDKPPERIRLGKHMCDP